MTKTYDYYKYHRYFLFFFCIYILCKTHTMSTSEAFTLFYGKVRLGRSQPMFHAVNNNKEIVFNRAQNWF